MLGMLIKKEIAKTALDLRFIVTTLLFVVLVPLGMYVCCQDYGQRMAAHQMERETYRQRYAKEIAPFVEAHGVRPPSVLSIFATGIDAFIPDKVITARSGLFRTVTEGEIDNPHLLLFGRADFLFNVVFVVSLAALVMTFDAISGEKEMGTLRLVLANAVPRSRILFSKMMGSYVALLIPFIISVLLALLVLDFSPHISIASPEVWPAFTVIISVTFLFVLAMVNLGLCVSALTDRSIDSIVLALFVWAVFVFAIPKLSPMFADILYPVESESFFYSTKRLIAEGIDRELVEEREKLREKCYREHSAPKEDMYTSSPETEAGKKANAKFEHEFTPIAERYQKRLADELRRVEQDYRRRTNVRSSIAVNLSRISPICSYTYLACGICGTGATEPENFTRNAQRYQDEMKRSIYDKIIVKRRRGGWAAHSVDGFDRQKATLPDMTYRYPGLAEALQTHWPDVLLLGIYDILFYVLTFMRLSRYDVR